MRQRTALYDEHIKAGAKIVPFAGWDMPLNYGSQIREHRVVREDAGMFDVSHMTVIDITGERSLAYLQRLVAADVARLTSVGQAQYATLLNQAGGIIDDLIAYRNAEGFRLVTNAGTRDKVIAWLRANEEPGVQLVEQALAMISVQGPNAIDKFVAVTGASAVVELKPFSAYDKDAWKIGRTGYTGEDGVEVILPNEEAPGLWRKLLDADVHPAGLAARDTLRLEAGLNLYGQDMTEEFSPLVSNVAWTVHFDPEERDFIGRSALLAQKASGFDQKLTGLVLETKGVMRSDQKVVTQAGEGVVTSGIFSPTLGYSIGLARVPRGATGGCQVEIRSKLLPARIVKPPFVKHGRAVFESR
ncbi:MAG: glycine cleavage system aminomethyltransferase GcvT [Gammaproteobacteria bacterium]|nr:glycine cleavage system aminomethyltransferase GcvT [Gammaproteobacteria bacterium]